MRCSQVAVTVALLKTWMDLNIEYNRKLNQKYAQELANDFQKYGFLDNPDLIAFNVDGKLINGQHRVWALLIWLTACPEVNLTIWICQDIPNDPITYSKIDKGNKRSNQYSVSTLMGKSEKEVTKSIQTLRFLYKNVYATRGKIAQEEYVSLIAQHDEALDCSCIFPNTVSPSLIKPAFCAALTELFYMDPGKAQEFKELMFSDHDMPNGHPAARLLNWFSNSAKGLDVWTVYQHSVHCLQEYFKHEEEARIVRIAPTNWDEDITDLLEPRFQ